MLCALDKCYFSTLYLENIGVIMVCFNFIDISHVLTSCLCILIMLIQGNACASYLVPHTP